MSVVKNRLEMYFEKEALPLKKPLALLDEKALAPYRVKAKQQIGYEEVIKALGTDQYLQWVLEDPCVPEDSPVRLCSLFITYYPVADRAILHVAEECYIGGGYRLARAGEAVTFRVDAAGLPSELRGRYLLFTGSEGGSWQDTMFGVFYLFNVNGRYAGSREKARFILRENLFGKYSYYSKVEWKFFNTRLGQTVYPSKEEALSASGRLLSVLLPELESEHWPDWPVAGVSDAGRGVLRERKMSDGEEKTE